MEIIEKEKIVEHQGGYDHDDIRRISGRATGGLVTGIIGTALGAWALFGNKRGGFGLGGGGSTNINVNGIDGTSNGLNQPTAFMAWEKGCEDTLALQKGLYEWALTQQSQRFSDRQTIDSELFGIYKSQVDGDFGLYKTTRDGFDALTAKQNADAFALYKNTRDGFDTLANRIAALETKEAVNAAIDPWRAKVLDMQIKGVAASAQAGINLEAERRCCADNKIVNYVNGTFYPIEVADVTVGSTSTAKTVYNPLCGCCDPCCGI